MMNGLASDIRFAIRQLLRRPGMTLLALTALALGTGSATAIFSLVYGVLLRPLPFPNSGRLVALCEVNPRVGDYCIASPPDVTDWSARSRAIESFGLARTEPMKLARPGLRPLGITTGIGTPGLFRTLGITAALGRDFEAADLEPANRHVVMLSDELWRSQFGSDPHVLHSSLTLDGEAYEVVGVLPRGLEVPELGSVKAWLPLPFSPRDERNRAWRGFEAFGRLARGSTVARATAELATINAGLEQQYPATNRGWSVRVEPLLDHVVGGTRPTLLVFLAAVMILMLVACANVANLLLARSLARGREFAVRSALGARPVAVFRLIAVESGMLALLGGVVGILVAVWATDALLALMPQGLPRVSEVHINAPVVLFALLVTLATGLLTGLVPAWRAQRVDLAEAMKEGQQPRGWGRGFGARGTLLVAEVALAFVLAVGAGLLTRSFLALLHWTPGFDTRGVLTFWTYPATGTYAQVPGRFARVEEELRALPGVVGVGMTSAGPLFGGGDGKAEYAVVGAEPAAGGAVMADWYDMSPDYFRTLGIALRRGRYFAPSDRDGAPLVAIVNEALARRYFPGRNPVGLRLQQKNHTETLEIVGVVADVPPFIPGEATPPELYWPYAQAPRWASYFVVRTEAGINPLALTRAVQDRILAIDPEFEPTHVATMEDLVAEQLKRPRFNMLLIVVFAGMALALTAVGVYGVIAASVAGRTREMGVRLALGASGRGVVAMVMREGLLLAVAGVAIGAVAAGLMARLARALLIGVGPSDAPTYAAIALLLVLAAGAACFLPARRAGRVDPMAVLRSD